MGSWFGSEKQVTSSKTATTGVGKNIMTASKNIGDGLIKLGEYSEKAEDKAKLKLDNKDAKQKTLDMEDALIKGYEEKHPKFMGKVDNDGKGIETYGTKTRLEKLALIQMVGNEVNNKKTPKIKNIMTSKDGQRIAVFEDGTEKVLKYTAQAESQVDIDLKKAKTKHYNRTGTKKPSLINNSKGIYNPNTKEWIKSPTNKDLGYGFNVDGSAKTNEQYTKQKNLKTKARLDLKNTEIN